MPAFKVGILPQYDSLLTTTGPLQHLARQQSWPARLLHWPAKLDESITPTPCVGYHDSSNTKYTSAMLADTCDRSQAGTLGLPHVYVRRCDGSARTIATSPRQTAVARGSHRPSKISLEVLDKFPSSGLKTAEVGTAAHKTGGRSEF